MKKLAVIASFILGAAAGSFATWRLTKKHYEQIAQEEINSVKETFVKINKDRIEADKKKAEAPKITTADYVRAYSTYANSYTGPSEDSKEEPSIERDYPYIIESNEFAELYGYSTITLTYYNDHVLADDFDEVIEEDEYDMTVGSDTIEALLKSDEDCIYSRNDITKTDYEICLDIRNFKDVIDDKE